MKLPFANRKLELQELDSAAAAGGLAVIFGRRRVGKTRLLVRWLMRHEGLYSQAIEAKRSVSTMPRAHPQTFLPRQNRPNGEDGVPVTPEWPQPFSGTTMSV